MDSLSVDGPDWPGPNAQTNKITGNLLQIISYSSGLPVDRVRDFELCQSIRDSILNSRIYRQFMKVAEGPKGWPTSINIQ